jgi:mannose-6-phosphate isomerase-like protein (cupin superfamily)
VADKAYETAHIDDLARIPVEEGLEWRPIRRRFGISAFGTNAYTADRVGGLVVEEHKEGSGHEEMYLVVSGRATFMLDGEEVDAPAGTLVFIPEGDVLRKARAEEEGTTVVAVGGWPDKPFEPSAWEWYFEAYGLPVEDGVATLEDGLRRFAGHEPQESAMLFHLACIENRAGRSEAAREHLDRAIELRPELREWANKDDDLASLEP